MKMKQRKREICKGSRKREGNSSERKREKKKEGNLVKQTLERDN